MKFKDEKSIIFLLYILITVPALTLSLKVKNDIKNGCSAYACNRVCISNQFVTQTPGDNGFKFDIENQKKQDDTYIPGQTYKVSLYGNRFNSRNPLSYTDFRGFLIVAVKENWYDALPFVSAGQFKIDPNDKKIQFTSGCNEMITHTHFEAKNKIEFHWTAPKTGSGCVSLKAHVIQTETLWFKDDGQLTKTLCEKSIFKKEEIKECCACDLAKYSLKFKGNWNKKTYPKHWPTNEGLTHWSNLIGAVHSRNYTLWDHGGFSSEGLQELAEFGIIRTLEQEIKNHTQFDYIRNIVRADGLWFPNVDKETSTEFTTSKNYHLLSFAAMLGPSPDWFSGVSKLNLCLQNCTWLDNYTEELYLSDAGTDSGISYSSPNKPSIPKESIKKITRSNTNDPRSPFYEVFGEKMIPFAYLTLQKQNTKGSECSNGKMTSHIEPIDPVALIEFDPYDYSDANRRIRLLDAESTVLTKKSRSKNSQLKFIENIDFDCMTSEWSAWTKCSSTCGQGLKKRSRIYKDTKMAMAKGCDQELNAHEMCLSENGECYFDQVIKHYEPIDNCLMVTIWSSWSPCSVNCGKGTTIRTRTYDKTQSKNNCQTKLIDQKDCMVNERCLDEDLMSYDEIRRICNLNKKKGPCRMTISNIRYYFDKNTKECLPFEYGGCRGNENNFETIEKCQKTCSLLTNEKNEYSKGLKNNQKDKVMSKEYISAQKKTCLLAREEGTCHESQIKYYFDRTKLTCLPFEFSGCGGNINNFDTLKECETDCHSIIDYISNDEKNSVNVLDLTLPEKKRICMAPAEKGTCSDSLTRYTYNINMNKCLPFEYSGCEGNLNNFENIKECESVCDILIQMAQQAQDIEESANTEIRKKEICMQPKEKGPCIDFNERYYFDTTMGKCIDFKFGGCYGNQNNFFTFKDCNSNCAMLIKKVPSEVVKKTVTKNMPKDLSHRQRKLICKQSISEGWCTGKLKRYHYNYYTKECEHFSYSGCNGNENNFLTHDECFHMCGNLEKNYTAEAILMSDRNSFGVMLPTNCKISEWSSWSECSDCNEKNGYSTRSRKIEIEAKYDGIKCPKVLKEKKSCAESCKNQVSCTTGKWSRWSECVKGKKCAENYQYRMRNVIGKYSGRRNMCPEVKEIRQCFLENCF